MIKKIKSPIGNKLTCKGWHQEAAFRMLQNNLDPDVAENPNELIVLGDGNQNKPYMHVHELIDCMFFLLKNAQF